MHRGEGLAGPVVENNSLVPVLPVVEAGAYAGLPKAPVLDETAPRRPIKTGQIRMAACGVMACLGLVASVADFPTTPTGHDRVYTAPELYPDQPLPPDDIRGEIDPRRRLHTEMQTAASLPAGSLMRLDGLISQMDSFTVTDLKRSELYQQRRKSHPAEDRGYSSDKVNFQIREQAAKRYGLTVFDPSDTLQALRLGRKASGEQLSFMESAGIANEYLANFGISLATDPNQADYAYHLQAADLLAESPKAKSLLITIVSAVSKLPLEYTDAAGIRSFLLAAQAPGTKMEVAAYINLSLQGRIGPSIVFNLSAGFDEGAVFHEYWHRFDYLMSGGWQAAQNDPSYETTTQGVPYVDDNLATAHQLGFFTLDEYNHEEIETTVMIAEKYRNLPGCPEVARAAVADLRAAGAKTIYVSTYAGSKDNAESKAEEGSHIPMPSYYSILLSNHTPIIAQQFKRELARFGYYFARLLRFFMAQASSPINDYSFIENSCRR